MKYPLTCPKCNKNFNLIVKDESKLLNHNFTCNKCGYTTPFVNMLSHLAKYASQMPSSQNPDRPASHIDLATHISHATGAGAGSKTRMARRPGMSPQAPGPAAPGPATAAKGTLPLYFEVEKSGRKLFLSPGMAVLGRDSQDSTATIKVAADPYMSRQSAQLDVRLNGNTVRVELTPLKSKNPVCINNVTLPAGQTKALKLGDRILLGETVITLRINK